jgi:O-antigen/teichoic acid export membrane protein
MLNSFFSRIMGIGVIQRQSIISLIWQIAYSFIGFLSTIYFAHAVGASVLGAYFLFMSYFGIINILTDGGLGGAGAKRISEGEEQDAYFTSYFFMRFALTIIIVITLMIFQRYFIDLSNSGAFTWLILALTVSIFHGAVFTGLAGSKKMGISSTSRFIGDVLRILFQVIAVFLGYNIAGLAGGLVIGILSATIIGFRFFDLHFAKFGWKHIKSLSTFSFWLFLTSSGVMLYSYSDKIIIGYYLTNADVGVYQIVWQFVTIAAFTTTALRSTLWPQVSHWGKIGEVELIEKSLSKAFNYSLILAIPVLVGGILLGDKLLYILYGAEFAGGYTTLVILLIVQIVNIFQFFFTSYLSALDRQKEAFKITAVSAVLNIMLNILIIPLIGIAGAAIATLLTMTINAFLAQRILSQMITMRIENDSIFNFLKASLIMALLLGVYRHFISLSNVWLTVIPVILCGILYGILILRFDIKIHDELKGIITNINLPWPTWL